MWAEIKNLWNCALDTAQEMVKSKESQDSGSKATR